MSELMVLQAVRLKGRVTPADLAATLCVPPADVTVTLEQLTATGLLTAGATLRISPTGRARLAELLTAERAGIDSGPLAAAYDDFRAVNRDFKTLVTDWQLKDGQPNAHQDAHYDAGVLARLDAVHQRVLPIIAAAAAQLSRLGAYATKLGTALAHIQAGDTSWLARPLIDSYHTVWFELHEELIGAVGLTRAAEARSVDAE